MRNAWSRNRNQPRRAPRCPTHVQHFCSIEPDDVALQIGDTWNCDWHINARNFAEDAMFETAMEGNPVFIMAPPGPIRNGETIAGMLSVDGGDGDYDIPCYFLYNGKVVCKRLLHIRVFPIDMEP